MNPPSQQPTVGTVDHHEEAPSPDGTRHYVVIETPEPSELAMGKAAAARKRW